MNDTPFHATRMGQRFYERTLPELVRQIERLNELLERVVEERDGRPSASCGRHRLQCWRDSGRS